MPTTATAADLADQASFVFRGSIRQLNAATLPEITDKTNTAIVRVDQIIHAPKALSHYNGQEITVHLAEPAGVNPGDEAVFFTNPWLFGNDGVAVRSLGHRAPDAETAALRAASDPVTNLEDRRTQAHYNEADLVVSGTVLSVRVAPDSMEARAPSEHDPQWREATVQINQLHKGDPRGNTVSVWFPASIDRAWHRAPKLHAGDTGHFMLHTAEGQADSYVLLHPEDFEPESKPDRVERLLAKLGKQ